jgi:uncharacterized protein (TIRG00374 family)
MKPSLKLRGAALGLALLTALYLAALAWVDSRTPLWASLPRLAALLPLLAAASLLSYTVRYARWRWLLARAGFRTPLLHGALAYLAGFALTATPGKAGELLRIRYFAPLGVPPARVLGAFVFERLFDLAAVSLLASLILFSVARLDMLLFALGFVALQTLSVLLVARNPAVLTQVATWCAAHRLAWLASACETLRDGLASCRVWLTLLDVLAALFGGILAWGITALSFVGLLGELGVDLSALMPPAAAVALFPLAMLAGAASLLPGGVGSTEIAIVALLTAFNVPLATATLAAVGIRVATLWFAVLCGVLAASYLELRG